ncbi:hypothetical protein ACFLU5_14305 [Bacteroidota bacterium]
MTVNKLHKFHLSYKLNGTVQLVWIEALNLRHAKEKIYFGIEEATDIRDWTQEKKVELKRYIERTKNGGVKVVVS